MKYIFNHHFLLALAVVFVSINSGCMYMLEGAVKKSFPTFQETIDSWPEIIEGKGRVVFYYAKQPISPYSATNTISFVIDQKKDQKAVLMDEMFLYDDLSAGLHSIEIPCKPIYVFNIKVESGELHYIKFYIEENSGHCLSYREVEKEQALLELKTMNHFFDNSESLHHQYNP